MIAAFLRTQHRVAVNSIHSASSLQKSAFIFFGLCVSFLFVTIVHISENIFNYVEIGSSEAVSLTAQSLGAHLYEYLFFFLLAGSVPFVAATVFQSRDLPLLLSTPVSHRVVMAFKLLSAIQINSWAGLIFGLPLLIGLGLAWHLSVADWCCLALSFLLLLSIAPSITLLVLLCVVVIVGLRRLRFLVIVVNIAFALFVIIAAVVGANRSGTSVLNNQININQILRGGTPPSSVLMATKLPPIPQWLPSSWAYEATVDLAKHGIMSRNIDNNLLKLLALTFFLFSGCVAAGAKVLIPEIMVDVDETEIIRNAHAGPVRPFFLALQAAGILWKDFLYASRDMTLIGQLATSLILFLVPVIIKLVPTHADDIDNQLIGISSLSMIVVILYMITSILGLSSVGLEGRSGWHIFAAPMSSETFLRAKWLFSFSLSYGIVLSLLMITWAIYSIQANVAIVSIGILTCAAFALSGLGVGLSGSFPRFIYENPAHRASVTAMILGLVFATTYLAVCSIIGFLVYFALAVIKLPIQWTILIAICSFVLISLFTGTVPIMLAAKRLKNYEWSI